MIKKKKLKPKRRPRGRPFSVTVNRLTEALKNAIGNTTDAAKQLGIHPETVRHRIRNSVKLRKLVDDIRENTIDLAESEMFKLLKSGDGPMIRFFLFTIGKNRGYVRRSQEQLVGKNGEPMDPSSSSSDLDLPAFTDTELRKLVDSVAEIEASDIVVEAKKITKGEN